MTVAMAVVSIGVVSGTARIDPGGPWGVAVAGAGAPRGWESWLVTRVRLELGVRLSGAVSGEDAVAVTGDPAVARAGDWASPGVETGAGYWTGMGLWMWLEWGSLLRRPGVDAEGRAEFWGELGLWLGLRLGL